MSEEFGYWKPPRSGQFRKGQSGNPKGRPRKARANPAGGSAFDVIVDRTLTVVRNGIEREETVEEALQHKTYQAALAGDRPSRREVLTMIAKRDAAIAKKRPDRRSSSASLEHNVRNADDALLILGIACEDPRDHGPKDTYRRLLLEPWAVQAALSR